MDNKFISTSCPKSPIINAISSIFSSQTFTMSSTNLCTIDLPTKDMRGLGVVKVCGRNLEPLPAIGIIMFI